MLFRRKPYLCFGVLLVHFIFWHANADVYMHNPRGSNNRLNENSPQRRNANRLFDSQNNNRGGYNVGEKVANPNRLDIGSQYEMEYFMSSPQETSSERKGKSFLPVEWTNQHGCGDDDLNCNIVLQYKCQDENYDLRYGGRMRNGVTTNTPQERPNPSLRYGLHEPWEWYDKCKTRTRNKGLFLADQKLRGSTSRYTRQNPNGNRRGFECPEERDYYPYWHPTDWIDEAVYVKREEDCAFYTKESFNDKLKGECLKPLPQPAGNKNWFHKSSWNNYWDCQRAGGTWVEFSQFMEILWAYKTEKDCLANAPKLFPTFRVRWAIPYRSEFIMYVNRVPENSRHCLLLPHPVKCKVAPKSRPNHLGNGEGVVPLRHQWILPYIPGNRAHRCVLRIRYNISTDDYNVSTTSAASNERIGRGGYLVSQSPIENDPLVSTGESESTLLQLAINTAQFGRTFQDRSHTFLLRPRPNSADVKDKIIHNINVRGKRGNIVQVYPAVEYDFIPKRTKILANDLVHFQWTGSVCHSSPSPIPQCFAPEG